MKKAINIHKLKRIYHNNEARLYFHLDTDCSLHGDVISVSNKLIILAILRGKVYWAEKAYGDPYIRAFSCDIMDKQADKLLRGAIYLEDFYVHTDISNYWLSLDQCIPNPFRGV